MASPQLIAVRKKKPQYWFESHRKKLLKIFKLDLALWKKPWTLTGHCLIEVLRVCLILIVTSFATCVIVEAKNSIILFRTILRKELQWVFNDFQWVVFSVFQEFFDYVFSSSWSFFLEPTKPATVVCRRQWLRSTCRHRFERQHHWRHCDDVDDTRRQQLAEAKNKSWSKWSW